MFSRNGQQNAELRLHPQELGALQISLKMEDNQAQLHFASAHSQVRAAIEAAMPSLRSAPMGGSISPPGPVPFTSPDENRILQPWRSISTQ